MPLNIDIGVIPQGKCYGFDENIVDADFDPVLFLIFVELGSEGHDCVHFDRDGYVVVGDCLF